MSFSLFIARRYLFSKKSHNAINIISGIAAGGIALATMALVCTLSVFNGFRDLIGGLYTAFDPQIQVVPAMGKTAAADDPLLTQMRQNKQVAAAANCLTDNALILFRGHPMVITVKGVDNGFANVTGIGGILYGEGRFVLQSAEVSYGIPGIGLAQQMGGADYGTMQICAPRGGERINLANPIESFSVDEVNSTGLVFSVNQRKYDDNLLLTSLRFAQGLLEKEGQISSLELRLKEGADVQGVKKELRAIAGSRFKVLDQMEQQEDVYRIMNIEKLIAYLFLTFILLVACFNIIGSLSMLIIEKRADVETLRHLGLTSRGIRRIFITEGRLISLIGAVAGIAFGVVLCLLQEHFGLIRLGSSEGNFIVDAYPVSIHWQDIVLIFATVIVVGFASVWYPVRYLSRRMLG